LYALSLASGGWALLAQEVITPVLRRDVITTKQLTPTQSLDLLRTLAEKIGQKVQLLLDLHTLPTSTTRVTRGYAKARSPVPLPNRKH
jgi:hypothetical protein